MNEVKFKDSVMVTKSEHLSGRIYRLYKFLKEEKNEGVMSKQIYRSGTSIGANIAESRYAQSKADFVHKLSIALKEANETRYWISCIYNASLIDEKGYTSLLGDVEEIIKILTSSIKTVKGKMSLSSDSIF